MILAGGARCGCRGHLLLPRAGLLATTTGIVLKSPDCFVRRKLRDSAQLASTQISPRHVGQYAFIDTAHPCHASIRTDCPEFRCCLRTQAHTIGSTASTTPVPW
jgi:hypothetical protein